MSYDKRRILRLYGDGKSYVLSSQLIENEQLQIKVVDSTTVCLNKLTTDEWASMKSKPNSVRSASFTLIAEYYGCLGLFSTINPAMQNRISSGDDLTNMQQHFLIFVKEANSVGTIRKFDILRITDVFILPLCSDINSNIYNQQPNSNPNSNLNYHNEIKYNSIIY
jgi:hypothetical protein